MQRREGGGERVCRGREERNGKRGKKEGGVGVGHIHTRTESKCRHNMHILYIYR